jgi:hypothetical protein
MHQLTVSRRLSFFPEAAQFAKHLAGAAKTYYGTPARAFIAAVLAIWKNKGLIRQGVQAFIDGRKLAAKR